MKKSGRMLMTVDLARKYCFTDVNGKIHVYMRSVKNLLINLGYTTLATFVPEFVRIPLFLIHYGGYKF